MRSLAEKRSHVRTLTERLAVLGTVVMLSACGRGGAGTRDFRSLDVARAPRWSSQRAIVSVRTAPVASFASPWSIAFLPDGRSLVTERRWSAVPGHFWLVQPSGAKREIPGLPPNLGMLDVILHPNYSLNHRIYFSFIEPGDPGERRIGRNAADSTARPAGLAVASAIIVFKQNGAASLHDLKTIWRQCPKIVSDPGSGEPGGRITFSPDGRYLFVTAGDRQEFEPAQWRTNTLGKVIRLLADGSIPPDNPFAAQPGALPEIWSVGHRNAYGLAFDSKGLLWENENGPQGGDELNLIRRGADYGWPSVSYGDYYTGEKIPKPQPGDGFEPAATVWTPAIAPSGMIFYHGGPYAAWNGDAIISGLQAQGLVRVHFTGTTAREVQRISLGTRIRDVIEDPKGGLWVLEDGPMGRLLRLRPIYRTPGRNVAHR